MDYNRYLENFIIQANARTPMIFRKRNRWYIYGIGDKGYIDLTALERHPDRFYKKTEQMETVLW